MQIGKLLVVLLCLSGLTSVRAQVNVVGNGKVAVSVVPFNGPNAEAARKFIIDNLNRTLLINATGATGDRYIISATTSPTGLMGRLYDSNTKADLLNKNYPGASDLRQASHLFSDAILEAITGVKGFATSRVAFISAKTGNKELYAMDIDGANVYALTNDQRISSGPAWSKDGRSVAYTSYKSGYPDVYVVKLANQLGGQNTRTRVAFFPGTNSGPSFSPDGNRLALMLSKDGNPEIYTIPTMGGAATRVTKTRGTETSPCWSPDGTRLVYTSDERGSVQLFITPASGGAAERLVTNSTYSAEPDWSPDGSKIAYTARMGGKLQVCVYDLNTKQVMQVTTEGGEDPSWTRNSRHLVFSNAGALYILDSVTRQFVRLENNLTGCSEPATSP